MCVCIVDDGRREVDVGRLFFLASGFLKIDATVCFWELCGTSRGKIQRSSTTLLIFIRVEGGGKVLPMI
jgi:hypothetical protein